MNRFSIFFLFFFLIQGLSFAQETNWKTFQKDNYEIQHPSDWSLDTTRNLGPAFFLFTQVADDKDGFRENVNLLIQDLTGYNMNLDQFVEISENQIETMITDGKILNNDRKRENDRDFHRLIYSGKQGDFDLKFLQYYFILDEKAYVLTLTCELDQFENYQEVGEKILSSFRIRD